MKFTTAWASIAQENVMLRIALASVSLCAMAFAVTSVKLSLKEPLIIERSCQSAIVALAPPTHTAEETQAFLKDAIEERFNSDTVKGTELLGQEEQRNREQEQGELAKRQMHQKVFVNQVSVNGGAATAEADRFLALGPVKSVLPLSLKLFFQTTTRTVANPYGLVLTKVEPVAVVSPEASR